MKTEDLIASLAAEPAPAAAASIERRSGLGVGAGAVVALGAFLLWWGVRPNLSAALSDPVVLAKTLMPAALAPLAWIMALHAARPGLALGKAAKLAVLVPVVALALLLWAFGSTPAADRMALFIGHSIQVCLPSITLLSMPILAGLILALRRGAPEHPGRCGALAGLAAAGLATTLYSTFCTEDSPLFYAVWYSLGIGIVTAIGTVAGRWALRW